MITQKELKELLHYKSDTGLFTWLKSVGSVKKGSTAGFIHHGYNVIKINKRKYQAHRLVFLYINGHFPENEIDHIDRNRSNNKVTNLREASRSCNVRNSGIRKDNKSGVVGVCYNKSEKTFLSAIFIKGKNKHLGSFKDMSKAVQARWVAEKKYGFPTCNTTSTARQYLKKHNLI